MDKIEVLTPITHIPNIKFSNLYWIYYSVKLAHELSRLSYTTFWTLCWICRSVCELTSKNYVETKYTLGMSKLSTIRPDLSLYVIYPLYRFSTFQPTSNRFDWSNVWYIKELNPSLLVDSNCTARKTSH